ncbi:RdgB/HAM1 family non-canonical purine NTP pyrophosphatase [Candidatus Omnitrophota bacterium]
MRRLVVATANKSKFKEIKKILGKLPLGVNYLLDFERKPRIVENGKTFFQNAKKKAQAASSFYGALSLGEDSGLEVVALDGRPGIFSSRFSGKGATDAKNIRKLLRELKGFPASQRRAAFVCSAVLMRKGKVVKSFQGRLSGSISASPRGSSGFGYDPVFYLPSLKKTLAQLPIGKKNKLSHRYKAIFKVRKYLRNYLKKCKCL